jgi:hypothetical protein
MTPPAAPKNQTPLDDEISFFDIIQFFNNNFKRILFFIIMGGILGYLYGKLASPVYDGSVLISPAKLGGIVIADPKITLTKLNMNSYYSRETLLACNPTSHNNSNYFITNIVKFSISKDGNFIELKMSSPSKEKIHGCLESFISDIGKREKNLLESLVQNKKNELSLHEAKLKLAEQFQDTLKEIQLKNFKTTNQRFETDLLVLYTIENNAFEINELLEKINAVKKELSSELTKNTEKVLPLHIEQKSFPYEKLGLLIGIFLGFCEALVKPYKRHLLSSRFKIKGF